MNNDPAIPAMPTHIGRRIPRHLFYFAVILAALVLCTLLVYASEGAGGAYTYLMLVPVLLADYGCDFGQGFFWTPALPVSEFQQWCANQTI